MSITDGHGKTAPTILFDDNSSGTSACLRCPDAPCMLYAPGELALGALPIFPADGTKDVCPTDAIKWPPDSETGPRVEDNACIGCALCVSRCPLGAIQIGTEGTAHVLDTATSQICDQQRPLTVQTAQNERAHFARAKRNGPLRIESDGDIENSYARIHDTLHRVRPRFPTLLTRNLLLGLGSQAAMRRLGDTNVRIDIAASWGGRVCPVEVEFSEAVVDAPRNVLDDLAVLVARYDQERSKVSGLVVALSLPNQRSEYWQVIDDISKVLHIKVATITVGALLVLLWNQRLVGREGKDLPYAAVRSPTIRASVESLLGRSINVSLGCESAFESSK